MSRSARYALGLALVLVLAGAGSGYAVAKWGQRDTQADWGAVVRGGECVANELRDVVSDVAGMLSPDRPDSASPGSGGDQTAPSGGETGGSGSTSVLGNLLAEGREFLDSISDGVPRLDDEPSESDSGC